MRDTSFYVSSLLELASASPADRRTIWRQAMAALSRASADGGPSPLEGLHPDVLLRGVQAATSGGLVDDLDWLAPEAAGVALYTLAAALPVGPEQRDLGRRVLARMLAGNADTFTAMATVMAQGGGKGLSSAAIRARVALVMELPLSHGIADGPLALALVTRRESAREWVAAASTRSLPARRLAAKILERAAREAARRAQTGDTHALRVFAADAVKGAWSRLLADRESLVWRYVAVARGLAAPWVPELEEQIHVGLAPGAGPTESRRSICSLAAFGAVNPEAALRIFREAHKRGLFSPKDPGIAGAFVWGLPRTMEAEPEAASKMLDALLSDAAPEVAESVAELVLEFGPSKIVSHAAERSLDLLRTVGAPTDVPDDGAAALVAELVAELRAGAESLPLRVRVGKALAAFVSEGPAVAHGRAVELLASAKKRVDQLVALAPLEQGEGAEAAEARRSMMAVLRDLDGAVLERAVLSDLLKLGRADQVRSTEAALDDMREQLAQSIVAAEASAIAKKGKALAHATLRMRRLRTLLHLIDGDIADPDGAALRSRSQDGEDVERAKRQRGLWLRTVEALIVQCEGSPPPMLTRTLLATLARAVDGVVRLGACEAADVLLVLAQRIKHTADFETLAEASMDPDLRHLLVLYAKFLRATEPQLQVTDRGDSSPPPSSEAEPIAYKRLRALAALADELAPDASARTDAVRSLLLRLHGAITALTKAGSLRGLSTSGNSEPDVIGAIEAWVGSLGQMCAGARSRLAPPSAALPVAPPQPRLLGLAVSRVLSGSDPELRQDALAPAVQELVDGLPHGIARLVSSAIWPLMDLPITRPSYAGGSAVVADQLPAWLPARRTIGGFYVVRALGVGGTASVFVVHRVEDRHVANAERFALKVPDYNATAARSVTQEEFFKLFREEASALLMLPNHANLARFVTFDLAARPLPILVMELVEGVTLERVIDSRSFDTKRALRVMDDILCGLEAMHGAGVGHLDLKPSNVVLRSGEQGVLVDFGLAGRKIRPGCGTGPYGAPEIWGVMPDGAALTPMAADIYAFGCMAFEMITGATLFDAPNEVALISLHVAHDGFPGPMRELMANKDLGPLAQVLAPTLRRDPRQRPTAAQLRRDIGALAPTLASANWPAHV